LELIDSSLHLGALLQRCTQAAKKISFSCFRLAGMG
jgi:hypothetical protein